MKILHVCSYFYPALTYGGPAKVVFDLALQQSKKNKVSVITTDVWDENRRIGKKEKLKSSKNFQVHYFPNLINKIAYTSRFFTGFGMVGFFWKNKKQFSIIHIHDIFIIPQLIIGLVAAFFDLNFVVSPHGVLDPVRLQKKSFLKAIVYFLLVKPVLSRAKVIIATSQKEKEDLKKLGFTNTVVVNNGVSLEKVVPTSQFKIYKSSQLTLLYVGKLHSQKGLFELLESIASFPKNKLQLLIAGPDDGFLVKLKQIKKQKKLINVHFLGFVNDRQKQELFDLADVFVYPSYAEGFSISILEALSQGLPAIITRGCNFSQVAKSSGKVIDEKNLKQELVEAINFFIENPSVLKNMSKSAKKMIFDNYSIIKMTKRINLVYEKII